MNKRALLNCGEVEGHSKKPQQCTHSSCSWRKAWQPWQCSGRFASMRPLHEANLTMSPHWNLVTGKYGCTEVRVYPAECGQQLGTDPSKNRSSKSLVLKGVFWRGNALGLVPSCRPRFLGYACTLYAPTSPLLRNTTLITTYQQFTSGVVREGVVAEIVW